MAIMRTVLPVEQIDATAAPVNVTLARRKNFDRARNFPQAYTSSLGAAGLDLSVRIFAALFHVLWFYMAQ